MWRPPSSTTSCDSWRPRAAIPRSSREAQAKREAAEREKTLPIAQKENKDLIGACTLAQMQIERVLKLDEAGAAGTCPSCGALQARGAVFCWQCGNELKPPTDGTKAKSK